MTSTDPPQRKNRLAGETSPYLLQHAHNPVDWYPWGPEALERARREDRPILLSIGYAACHWCHVMERESFESEDIARVMNAHFVCIKVDREERPDLDEIYMAATVALSGGGGWPMTVFLTPDQRPFFAGTYFPPEDRHGRPGFRSLLERLAELWRSDRETLFDQARRLTEHVRAQAEAPLPANLSEGAIDKAAQQLAAAFDPDHGGFGRAPKFPPSAQLSLLLRHHRLRGDAKSLQMVRTTLDGMKQGGIYDHVGGGFARYSTDERWLVPHFEKMLYDNAQLARIYLEAHQVTGDPEYRRVAVETLDYVVREMQSPEGGYYSATDADSEGVEGKFFVWTPEEIEEILGQPDAERFCEVYDIQPGGNWEGVSIPNTPRRLERVASELGIAPEELRRSVEVGRAKVYEARARRVPPLLDDKVLTAWNGLMIGAMAEGYRVLGDRRYLESATRAARFVLERLRRPDGGLFRTERGGRAHLDAYLEDYAYLADALVDLYEAGAEARHLEEALSLAERMVRDFGDEAGGAFFHTARGHEALIVRPREGHDGALPNPGAVAARCLARLAAHLDREDLRERAVGALRAYGRLAERQPRAFATALGVADFLLEGPVEIVLAGTSGAADREALAGEVARHYLPNRVVGHVPADGAATALPLVEGKGLIDGKATLYVCRRFVCEAPATSPEDAARALREADERNRAGRAHLLSPRALAGGASPEGTAAYARRFEGAHGARGYTAFGRTGLVASRLGFGGYRVDDMTADHREALRLALSGGCNLIDTSTNYTDGRSETLVGQVLGELCREGKLSRSEVLVVSKIGYVQGANLKLARQREESERPFPGMVRYEQGLWHCIHPEWLEDQLTRSLERLGLERLDVCLLHNPEYFLMDARRRGEPAEAAREELYRRLGEAFVHLEVEVARGRIGGYGVSSNTVAAPGDDPEGTELGRMLEAARRAGGAGHHFQVLQLPMNLFEAAALLETKEDGRTVLERARAEGVAVLVNRPLNAVQGDRLLRLADPPALPDAPPLQGSLDRLRALEDEFAARLAPRVRMAPGSRLKAERLFQWADQLAGLPARIDGLEQWAEIESQAILPQLSEVVSALDRAFGDEAEDWTRWRDAYLGVLAGILGALRQRGAERSRARSRAVGQALDAEMPEQRRGESLSRKAIWALASAPGVTTVLVGMRAPAYVEDALGVLGWPPAEHPERLFRAVRGVPIRDP